MADSLNADATNALRAKLHKILVGEKPTPGSYLSFITGGYPQSEYTLGFLQDPSQVDQAHDFAMLTNTIPVSVGDWVAAGTSMWTRYEDWLDRYDSPPFSLTDKQKADLESATALLDKWFDPYTEYESEYNNMYFEWYDLQVMPKEDRPKDYNTQLARAKRLRDQALKVWEVPTKGNRAAVERAMATVSDLERRDPVFTKDRMRKKLGQPIESAHGAYYPTFIYPANPLGEGQATVFRHLAEELAATGEAEANASIGWPKFTFASNEVKEYNTDNNYQWGGRASVGSLFWSAGVDHEGTRQYSEYSSDTNKLSMEFELLRAPILRPWFDTYLLTGRGWKWPSMSKEHPETADMFSDGKLPAEGGWQMIPTEVIMVRNLKVKMDMSSSVNRETLTKTKSTTEAGFGFFKIKGSVETTNGTKAYEFTESSDGIECAQPQIVGYFCRLMPKSPNPDWSLWNTAPLEAASPAPLLDATKA
ncbi:MAG: hypothetical protein ACRYFV_09850 [Janthinobacterium lividum]